MRFLQLFDLFWRVDEVILDDRQRRHLVLDARTEATVYRDLHAGSVKARDNVYQRRSRLERAEQTRRRVRNNVSLRIVGRPDGILRIRRVGGIRLYERTDLRIFALIEVGRSNGPIEPESFTFRSV